MATVKRQIVTIDEENCDGCGNCVPACVEGALQVIDGKARLVKQSYCDGLGACLGDCPQNLAACDNSGSRGLRRAGRARLPPADRTQGSGAARRALARAWNAVIVCACGQSAAGRHPALPLGADAGVGRRTNDEGRTGAKPCQVGICVSRPVQLHLGAHAGALCPGHEPHPGRRLWPVVSTRRTACPHTSSRHSVIPRETSHSSTGPKSVSTRAMMGSRFSMIPSCTLSIV